MDPESPVTSVLCIPLTARYEHQFIRPFTGKRAPRLAPSAMSEPSWINTDINSTYEATATIDQSTARLDSKLRDGGTFGCSSAATLDKAQKDLLALIDEYCDLPVGAAMVKTNPREATRVVTEKRASEISAVLTRIRGAERLQVAFLVDTTGSMAPYIRAVTQQIQSICSQLVSLSSGTATRSSATGASKVAVGFIGYKDFCDGPDHFEIYPFSSNISTFQRTVASIPASGGGDRPEDVNGGLQMVLSRLDWEPLATKVIFHMGDAPPHGAEYSGCVSSSKSRKWSARNDEPIDQLFRRMMKMEIDYYFGKITQLTDKMVKVFSAARGRDVKVYDVGSPLDVTDSVVTATITSRDSRVKLATALPDGVGSAKRVVFDKSLPDWDALPLAQGAIASYKHPKSIASICDYVELESTARRSRVKIAPAPFAEGSVRLAYFAKEYFRVRGEDEMSTEPRRSAFVASVCDATALSPKRASPPEKSQNIVCKVFKAHGEATSDVGASSDRGASYRYRCMVAMEMQTITSYLARQFNLVHAKSKLNVGFEICYLKCSVLALKDSSAGTYKYFVVEKKLEMVAEQWFKVINNAGTVTRGVAKLNCAVVEYLTAFAHWTYCVTGGYLMVTDLQGVVAPARAAPSSTRASDASAKKTILLTDPAVHCTTSTRFGRTNLGEKGMALFFESHECNEVCSALHLKAPSDQELASMGGK